MARPARLSQMIVYYSGRMLRKTINRCKTKRYASVSGCVDVGDLRIRRMLSYA